MKSPTAPIQDMAKSPPSVGDTLSRDAETMSGVADVDVKMANFLKKLSRKVDVRFPSNPFRNLDKRVILASGARTGSHFLAEKLQKYGIDVKELFSANRIAKTCDNKGFDSLFDYCTYVLERFAHNGVFGIKGGTAIMSPLFAASELPCWAREWSWIYLKREDVVKQSVSHFLAQKSGTFRLRSEAREQSVGEHEYDTGAISEFITKHNSASENWEKFFDRFSIQPCRITYEQLAGDPDGVAASVAEFAGLGGPPIPGMKPPEAALKKQSNTLNAVWEARFLEERPEFRAGVAPPAS